VGSVERRDELQSVWVLWRGEMGYSVGAVERIDGLKCGFCGEERWAEVWVLWRG